MNTPSEEQQLIIDEIMKGNNVIVDACAGSGKSTTILSCAISLPHKQILQTTYNNQLRQEVKTNIENLDLKNIQVYTYHSIAVKYYFSEAFDDNGIRKILRENMIPKITLPSIDLLVLDECQDMSFLYFQFMVKFAKDINNPLQLLILGDKMQSIYSFRGANSVFLTSAKELWENHPLLITNNFVNCSLHTSYRITEPMSHFVNNVMLGENRLIACKPGIPVYYIRRPIYQISLIVIYQIKTLISENKCTYGDIFILAGSVKKDEIKKIENAFVESGIPCYVPMVDTQDRLDNRAIDKKVVFSTFHAVKGRQRRYVFVVGFDSTFYYKYDNQLPRDICPNTLYVSCTRATDGLYLLENDDAHIRPLPFLQITHQEMKQMSFIHFVGNAITMLPVTTSDSENKEKVRYITPTSLIQFVSENTLDIISPLLEKIYTKMDTEKKEIDIPSFISTQNGFYEEISDLNGNAIPIMYCEHLMQTKCVFGKTDQKRVYYNTILQQIILELSKKFHPNKHLFLKTIIKHMPEKCDTISDYLYLSNILQAVENKLYSKLKQIQPDEYNWIKDEAITQCFQLLDGIVGEDCNKNEWKSEQTILHYSADEDHFEMDMCLSEFLGNDYKYRFHARIDLLTDSILWEFKCTSKISVEHMLQLVIYAWIWLCVYNTPKQFRLYNIKTNELWELNASKQELTKIVVELIRSKYNIDENKQNMKTDADYIAQAKSLFI
jgi:hypothetical protein